MFYSYLEEEKVASLVTSYPNEQKLSTCPTVMIPRILVYHKVVIFIFHIYSVERIL